MKKVLSLMLVLVLVLGMSTVAFAAPKNKKLDPKGDIATLTAMAGSLNPDTIEETIQEKGFQKEWKAAINTSLCYDKANDKSWASSGMTVKERKDSKVTIKTTIKKGSAAIDEVKFGGDKSTDVEYLMLVLQDELKNTNSDDGVEFEVRSYLVVDGKHWTGETFTWSGNLKNDIDEDVNADYEYIFMGNGTIIKPEEYIKSIECDLDSGVSVFAKMFKDKKYWAVADDDPTDDQEIIMDKYGIDGVYNLRNVGLAAVTDYVLLDEDSDMFVYDGNFKYLGKGSDKLPWSDTYYLAAKQLDIEEDDEPIDDEDGDDPELPEDLGGDDDYPANVNDNPGTGC